MKKKIVLLIILVGIMAGGLSYWFNPYSNSTTGLRTGDSSFVKMDPSTSLNLQGNLIFNLSSLVKVRYEAV